MKAQSNDNLPEIKEGEWVKKNKGYTYVYLRRYYYNADTKNTTIISSTLLYKLDKDGNRVPTRKKAKMSNKTKSKICEIEASRVKVGGMELLNHIGKISGIDQDLYDITVDNSMAQKILSIARYWIYTGGNTLPGIEEFQLVHTLPYLSGITEDIYHDLFEKIGLDTNLVQNYFKKRIDFCDCAIIIAYDASAESTYGHIPFATAGFDKEGIGIPTIKYIVLYSISNNQPIAYTRSSGNISDVSTVLNALLELEALGAKVIDEVVTDNGYASDFNFATYVIHGFNYLTRAKNSWTWIQKLIDNNYKKLGKPSSYCDAEKVMSGIQVKDVRHVSYTFPEDWREHKAGETIEVDVDLNVFIYRNSKEKEKEDREFRFDISELMNKLNSGVNLNQLSANEIKAAKKYLNLRKTQTENVYTATMNNSAIERVNRYHGILVLVGSKDRTTENALSVYRLREKIEEDINIKKDDCDGKRPRVWSEKTYDGKLFVQFVAMGYYHVFYRELNRIKKEIEEILLDPKGHKIISDELTIYRKLKTWLHDKSLKQILNWFDNKEMTTIHTSYAKRVITSETTKRDDLFVDLFMKDSSKKIDTAEAAGEQEQK
jgi:hypothetical protein